MPTNKARTATILLAAAILLSIQLLGPASLIHALVLPRQQIRPTQQQQHLFHPSSSADRHPPSSLHHPASLYRLPSFSELLHYDHDHVAQHSGNPHIRGHHYHSTHAEALLMESKESEEALLAESVPVHNAKLPELVMSHSPEVSLEEPAQPPSSPSNSSAQHQHSPKHQHSPEHQLSFSTEEDEELQLLLHWFEVHDLNLDGYLDGHELLRAFSEWARETHRAAVNAETPDSNAPFQSELDVAEELVDLVIAEDDRNGDGRVSIGEFLNSQHL